MKTKLLIVAATFVLQVGCRASESESEALYASPAPAAKHPAPAAETEVSNGLFRANADGAEKLYRYTFDLGQNGQASFKYTLEGQEGAQPSFATLSRTEECGFEGCESYASADPIIKAHFYPMGGALKVLQFKDATVVLMGDGRVTGEVVTGKVASDERVPDDDPAVLAKKREMESRQQARRDGTVLESPGAETVSGQIPNDESLPTSFTDDQDWGACWFELEDGTEYCNESIREVCPVGEHYSKFEPKTSCPGFK